MAISTSIRRLVNGQPKSSVVLPATSDRPPAILIEVPIPADLALNLQLRAGPDKPLADHIADLASRFGDYPVDDLRGMWLDGDTIAILGSTMGRSFQSGAELADALRKSKTLSIGKLQIQLPDDILELVRARSYAPDIDVTAEIRNLIDRAFERYRYGE